MAETIPGGAYLAVDGKTFVDSEGRPLSPAAVAQAQARADDKIAAAALAAQAEQAQRDIAAGALRNLLVGAPLGAPAPAVVTVEAPSAEPPAEDDVTEEPGKAKRGGRK